MADAATMDRTYNVILRFIVENGEAPHYTEMARESVFPLPKAGNCCTI
jgi:hypothetical protein